MTRVEIVGVACTVCDTHLRIRRLLDSNSTGSKQTKSADQRGGHGRSSALQLQRELCSGQTWTTVQTRHACGAILALLQCQFDCAIVGVD